MFLIINLYFPQDSFEQVFILKGVYSGHHPISAVAKGMIPISPNSEVLIIPTARIIIPNIILIILSVFPKFLFIFSPFNFYKDMIYELIFYFSNLCYITKVFRFFFCEV